MRRKLLIAAIALLALTMMVSSRASLVSAAATQGWNVVQNPDFDGGTYSYWNPTRTAWENIPNTWFVWDYNGYPGHGVTFTHFLTTDSAADMSDLTTVSLGNVVVLDVSQTGGASYGAAAILGQDIPNYHVTSLTTLYGLIALFRPIDPCCDAAGMGVHIKDSVGDVGDLEYYVSNTAPEVGQNWRCTMQSICINPSAPNTYPPPNQHDYYFGVSDAIGAGRRLLSDIASKYPGVQNLNPYITDIHIWAYAHAGIFGESCAGRFKGICLGEYPSPTVTASPTAFTDPGYGKDTSTTVAITSDGGVPMEGGYLFPTDGAFHHHPVSFRGGISSYTIHVGSYSWSDSSHTINYNDITRDIYATSGTITCADGVSSTASGPSIVDGYALQVTVNWNYVDSGYKSTMLHYKQLGSWATETVGTSAVTEIIDPGTTPYLDAPSNPGTYKHINTANSTSWAPTSSSSQTVNYYGQYEARWSPSGLGGHSVDVKAMRFGSWSDQGSKSDTFDVWVDASGATNLEMDRDYNVSSTERYDAPTYQWTVSIPSPYSTEYAASAEFYHQWKPVVTLSGTSSSHTVTAYYTLDGNTAAQSSGQYSSWSGWVDSGAALTFSLETTGGSSTERWHWYGAGWTITSAITPSIAYIHQYYVTLNPLDRLGSPLGKTVSVQYTGDDGSGATNGTYATTFSAPWGRWMNAGTTLSTGKLTSGSSLTDQWYCYNGTLSGDSCTFTVSASQTIRLVYFHQFRPELQLLSSQYGGKVYDDYYHVAVRDWVYAAAWLWDSDMDARPVKVGTFTFKWIAPSGQTIHMDKLQSSSCYTDSFQIPQTYGEWKLQVAWNDGATVTYNRTVTFDVCEYTLQAEAQQDNTASNINLAFNLSLTGGGTIPPYGMLIALTTGGATTTYMRSLNLVYGSGLAEATYLSTSFFTTGAGVTWGTHIRNLDCMGAHQVAFRVTVRDPLTGYVYMDVLSSKLLLQVGGDGDLALMFRPRSSWWRNGLLNVTYTFYVYDPLGGNEQSSPEQYFGGTDPISWVMRGTGVGDVKAVYYFTGLSNSSILARIPVSLLASSVTAGFYLAWEDRYALSTQSQIQPITIHYLNVTSSLLGSETSGSGWHQEGSYAGINTNQVYYSSTSRRYVFTTWSGSGVTSPGNHSTTVLVDQPKTVTANWGLQWLTEAQQLQGIPQGLVTITVTQNSSTHTYMVQGTWVGWVDNGTTLSIPEFVQVQSIERYHTLNATAYLVESAKTISRVRYLHQWLVSVALDGTSQQHSVNATYTLDNTARVTTGLCSSWSNWVDENSTIFLPANGGGSTGWERWHTYNSTAIKAQPYVGAVEVAYMHEYFVEVTFTGGDIFATGCVPPSKWITEGMNITLNVESPFHPKPPYCSNTTRFIFLGWRWIYLSAAGECTTYFRWVSENATRISMEAKNPVRVIAYWRTQYLIEFTPYVPTTAPSDTVQVSYTVNAALTNMGVKSASTVRVWVDAYTLFTMNDLWVNDYTWYGVNYDTPSKNVTGGASLTLPYVEKTNKVSNTTIESNNFEAGGTLTLNLTLTTTYFNAQWINVTVTVASENAILIDRKGVTWSNVKIQLQNNTALIVIPLPEDIGNGTLMATLTSYGKVEPATKQIIIASSAVPPQPRGGTDGGAGANLTPAIAIIGMTFGGVLAASVSIRVVAKKRGDKHRRAEAEVRTSEEEAPANVTPTTSTVMRRDSRVAELQLPSLVKAVAMMELDVERGVQLRVLQDGDSRFIRFLERDVTRCGDYFDTAAKSYPGTLSITKWGDHITFVPYSKRGGSGRGRHMKTILIVSTLRELRNSEVEELKRNMLTKPRSTNEKLSAARDSTPETQGDSL